MKKQAEKNQVNDCQLELLADLFVGLACFSHRYNNQAPKIALK